MNSKLNYIKENLDIINKMIDAKRPKFEIARVLNVKYSTLIKHFKTLGIEYKGNPNRKGIPHYDGRKDVNEYLKENTNISAPKLRTKLIESGLKEEKCECCGNTKWMGKKIPLELHHKNFNHYDNRLENLQILCSNCHSIAHDYNNTKGKDVSTVNYKALDDSLNKKTVESSEKVQVKKDKAKRFCKTCGKELTNRQKNYCSYKCRNASSRKIPSVEELTAKLHEFNFNKSKTGRYFGVSDQAVKKWIIKYGIK